MPSKKLKFDIIRPEPPFSDENEIAYLWNRIENSHSTSQDTDFNQYAFATSNIVPALEPLQNKAKLNNLTPPPHTLHNNRLSIPQMNDGVPINKEIKKYDQSGIYKSKGEKSTYLTMNPDTQNLFDMNPLSNLAELGEKVPANLNKRNSIKLSIFDASNSTNLNITFIKKQARSFIKNTQESVSAAILPLDEVIEHKKALYEDEHTNKLLEKSNYYLEKQKVTVQDITEAITFQRNSLAQKDKEVSEKIKHLESLLDYNAKIHQQKMKELKESIQETYDLFHSDYKILLDNHNDVKELLENQSTVLGDINNNISKLEYHTKENKFTLKLIQHQMNNNLHVLKSKLVTKLKDTTKNALLTLEKQNKKRQEELNEEIRNIYNKLYIIEEKFKNVLSDISKMSRNLKNLNSEITLEDQLCLQLKDRSKQLVKQIENFNKIINDKEEVLKTKNIFSNTNNNLKLTELTVKQYQTISKFKDECQQLKDPMCNIDQPITANNNIEFFLCYLETNKKFMNLLNEIKILKPTVNCNINKLNEIHKDMGEFTVKNLDISILKKRLVSFILTQLHHFLLNNTEYHYGLFSVYKGTEQYFIIQYIHRILNK